MADPGEYESAFDDQFNAGNPVFGYTNEFIFDSDEGSPLPTIPDDYTADSSHAMPDAPQDCPSPSEALVLASRSSRSAESPRESMFDSASRKGTASSASTMPAVGDMRTNAGAETKQSWGAMDSLGGGTDAEDMSMMRDAFEFLTDHTLAQPSLRTPADTPSAKKEGDAQEVKAEKGGEVRDEGDDEQIKTQEGGEVQICENCIGRETKRASRKKSKNPEDEAAWQRDEHRRVIVFNTHEIKDWTIQNPPESGSRSFWQMQAPMRIACYCRHHAEKQGFQIIFTLTDHLGRLLVQTLSPTIMITDDHKTTSPNPVANTALGPQAAMLSPREDLPAQSVGTGPPLEASPSLDPQAARRSSAGSVSASATPQQNHARAAISRPPSPSFTTGPAKRRRGNKSMSKTPSDLTMTPIDTSFLPASRAPNPAASTSPMAQTTSSLPPTPGAMFTSTGELPIFGAGAGAPEPLTNGFASNPQANPSNGQMLLPNVSRTPSLANLATPMFGLSVSARPHTGSSPVASRPASSMASGGQARPQQPQKQPAIFKVIPGEGPVAGGIEVTLMGQGFVHGMQVMFGDKQAPGTACWSSESLVCLLPPSEMAGMVPVTLKHQNGQSLNPAPHFFRYVDDSEQQLLRTALMILGNKMTGGYEDVADFARRIIKEAGSSYPPPGGEMSGADGSSNRSMDNFESHLLKLLELMDLSNSTRKPRLNLRRSTGQTMLHLACKMGLHRFVAGLLARGANPDPRDKGGYTALHMASMNNHTEIVRLLIAHGADPTLRTLSGLTAADVAKSRDVVRLIHNYRQHRRSQSDSSSQSRVTSTLSLKSLRAQVSLSEAAEDTSSDEPRSGEESSGEYSEPYASDALVESDDGGQMELRMRRGKSAANTPARRRSPSRPRRRGTDATGPLGLPSAAMAAIKEQVAAQFQQLQQMMEPHLQYLPQLPQLPQFRQFPQFSQLPNFPQMPNMPPLPEYQNAVLQRLAAMIGAARSGAADDGSSTKEQESAWQYPSPFSTKSSTPPPAYDELFPQQGEQGDLAAKEASAAQAAADAVADAKCAALFDQPSSSSAAATARRTTALASETSDAAAETDKAEDSEGQEIPALLQIGRKDAITREQQATLRRAHAHNLKKLTWDRNLFFIWIPLLVLIVGAMLYRGMPGFVTSARGAGALVPEADHNVRRDSLRHHHQQNQAGAIAEGVGAAGV
ncbi:d3e38138-6a7e-4439-8f77-74354d859fd1 [Thermothielavioides terrestris]|uniref:D3e38138-6a7e-4439-8f77-74354d859fd1 n=1 Tax=Thermothielavioides terrestris TaxID=2587410 RepID=A0A3S4BRN4_9PEZI|nr:d3e38138-6a7e-4439-8f77-74354d859fd1 [Thermothielavioides terrestris]